MTKTYTFTNQQGRLDRVLAELLPETSRTTVQGYIKEGHVSVNGAPQKANYQLEEADEIIVTIPQIEQLDLVGEAIPLNILFEDDDLLVINKQRGLVVHPSKGHPNGTLVNGLIYYLDQHLSHREDAIRPGIVHRLDKDTSGVMIVAKNNWIHQQLAERIEAREVDREYTAIVNRPMENDQGMIELPIGRDPNHRTKFMVTRDGKEALTTYQRIRNFKDISLVKLQLHTGRTHQIRVHLEYIGHPIIGDPVYRKGLGQAHHVFAKMDNGQLLHASRLAFTHPRTGENIDIQAPLPSDMQVVLDHQMLLF